MSSPPRPRLMLIGPRPRPGEPIGGTQVSFAELCENFAASGAFELDIVDTTRPNTYSRGWRRRLSDARSLLSTLWALQRRARHADLVMFNASAGGVMAAGPWIARLCKHFERPLVVRAFGGALDLAFDAASDSKRAALASVLGSARLVLLQTDHLCARFAGFGAVRKLPTTRRAPTRTPARSRHCRRFVFISQLRPEKGFAEALRAIELCPRECTLDIYGPSLPQTDLLALRSHPRAVYHGALPHEHVSRVLAEHDALIFPSYHEGEGMPGVVVEALQCGLPVIAARWRAIAELVHDEQCGLLAPPKDAIALAAAMTRLSIDDALYAELCVGAAERGRELDAGLWQRRLESWLLDLCGRARRGAGAAANYREVSP